MNENNPRIEQRTIAGEYAERGGQELASVNDFARLLIEHPLNGQVSTRSETAANGHNTVHDTVVVNEGTLEVARDITDAKGATLRSTAFKADGESLWVKGGDDWVAVTADGDADSYRIAAYANRLIMEASARITGSIE